jgi:polyisoprenoid-binding protein YceI
MKKRISLLLLGTALVFGGRPGSGQASDFEMSQIFALDAGHSYAGFKIKYMGFAKVRGRFSEVSGAIRYDDSNPTMTSATIRISVESLDTDNARRDKDLLSDQWFDVETFPTMTFRSLRAIETAVGFDLVGELTIRDVTREVRIKMDEFSGLMKDIRADTQVIFVGHTVIDRKEFGVEGERWSKVKEGITGVDSKVEIELTVLAKQINEQNYRNRVRDQERPQGRIYTIVVSDGVAAGLVAFDALRAEDPDKAHPGVLKIVGNMLLKEGRKDDAVTVFQHNCQSFPEVADLHVSLAEAYAVQGDIERAKKSYEIVLRSDPDNVMAIEVMRHLDCRRSPLGP